MLVVSYFNLFTFGGGGNTLCMVIVVTFPGLFGIPNNGMIQSLMMTTTKELLIDGTLSFGGEIANNTHIFVIIGDG